MCSLCNSLCVVSVDFSGQSVRVCLVRIVYCVSVFLCVWGGIEYKVFVYNVQIVFIPWCAMCLGLLCVSNVYFVCHVKCVSFATRVLCTS